MTKKQNWMRQAVVPSIIGLIGVYGLWDVVVKPIVDARRAESQVCTLEVDNAMVIDKSGNSPQAAVGKSDALGNLPTVVPLGQVRTVTIHVKNPNNRAVQYKWQAKYGQLNPSGMSLQGNSVYTAPARLVNDTITVEVKSVGCAPVTRSLTVAVVPSASSPSVKPSPQAPSHPPASELFPPNGDSSAPSSTSPEPAPPGEPRF
jgi:hypothetical protein